MKSNDSRNPKKKDFLKIPTYPGGKVEYLKFINENIVYPEQALANRIEGDVYVVYNVDNIGKIVDVEVIKGIGHGCDEEAIRVIRMLVYEPARNRGVRMKVEMRTRIHFKLPLPNQQANQSGMQLNYTTVTTENANSPEPKPQTVYNYTIQF